VNDICIAQLLETREDVLSVAQPTLNLVLLWLCWDWVCLVVEDAVSEVERFDLSVLEAEPILELLVSICVLA
jgi:hypothetical protein